MRDSARERAVTVRKPQAVLAALGSAVGLVATLSHGAVAQPRGTLITGTVADARTGTPLAGAYLQEGHTGSATLTDEQGFFRLSVAPAGSCELIVVHDAYRSRTVRVAVADQPVEVDVELEASGDAGDQGEVIVMHGEAPSTGEPTNYQLAVDDIRAIPGAGNDALKSLQALPGVGRVPFGLGGLIVRGVSPRDSAVYLDGVEVPLLYHFGGLASFYPSALLESIDLTPGGFSTEYGRALGGVVTLESRGARRDRWRGATEVSLMDASVRGEGPGPAGGAVSVGLRRSYVEALLPLFEDDAGIHTTVAPAYLDAQLRYTVDRGPEERFSLFLFGSDDKVALQLDDSDFGGDEFDYRSRFVRLGARWQKHHRATGYQVLGWMGYDRFGLVTRYQDLERSGTPAGVRASFHRTLSGGYLAGGLDVQSDTYDLSSFTDNAHHDVDIRGLGGLLEMGGWSEALYQLEDGRIGIKPGVRAEFYSLSNQWVFDPRLVVSHRLPAGITVREAMGIYHQPPLLADYLWGNTDLVASRSLQGSVGVDARMRHGVSATLTGFYTRLSSLPVDDPSVDDDSLATIEPYLGGALASSREFVGKQFGSFSALTNQGRGESVGLELQLRRSGPSWFGWISYTLSRSRRLYQPTLDQTSWGWVPFALDQPHVLTALLSTRWGRWRLGGRLRYATGLPITPRRDFGVDDRGYVVLFPNRYPFSERLPDSFQLDFRVDRTWNRSWGVVSLYLDIQNLTNRHNVEGRMWNESYTEATDTTGLPFFPSFGLEIRPIDS